MLDRNFRISIALSIFLFTLCTAIGVANASSSPIALQPAWELPCEERVARIAELGRSVRIDLAGKIVSGVELSAEEKTVIADIFENLRMRIVEHFEPNQRVEYPREIGLSQPFPNGANLRSIDAAIALLNGNRLREAEENLRRWLAHQILRPQHPDLLVDDAGFSLRNPSAGEAEAVLADYLSAKFHRTVDILAGPRLSSGERPHVMLLQSFPGGPSLALNVSEKLTDEVILGAINAAFHGQDFYSPSAVAVLAYHAATIIDLLAILRRGGWQYQDLEEQEFHLLTNPRNGQSISISQTHHSLAPLSQAARVSVFEAILQGHNVSIQPREMTAGSIRLFAHPTSETRQ